MALWNMSTPILTVITFLNNDSSFTYLDDIDDLGELIFLNEILYHTNTTIIQNVWNHSL